MTLQEELKQARNATLTRMPQSIIKVFKEGIEEIRSNKLKEKSLQVGERVPNHSLTDIHGKSIDLQALIQSKFLLLNFYRGGWCPYCNMELRAYEKLKNDFLEIGANIVAISAEVPTLAAKTTHKNVLSFPVLTDKDAQFMKTIGIVFQLNEDSKRDYANFGLDLTSIHGNENDELPVPAVYVINKNREIVFVHFEEDYMTRIDPSEVLYALKKQPLPVS